MASSTPDGRSAVDQSVDQSVEGDGLPAPRRRRFTKAHTVSVRPGELLAERLHVRLGGDSPAAVIKRSLVRYYDLLDKYLERLELTEAEAGLLCEAAEALQAIDEDARLHVDRWLWAELSDAVRAGLNERWQVPDPDALVDRIRALGPGEVRALVDAIERYWIAAGTAEPEALLRHVGLVKGQPQ